MARRLYRTRTPTRSPSRLAPCLRVPLRHSSSPPLQSSGPLLALFLGWLEESQTQTCQANPFSLNDTTTILRLAPSLPLVLMSSLNTLPTSLSNQSTCRFLHLVPASHQLSALTKTISYGPICSHHFAPSVTLTLFSTPRSKIIKVPLALLRLK